MAPEEAVEPEEPQQTSGPMITKKGWVVVLVVLLLQTCAFLVFLWFRGGERAPDRQPGPGAGTKVDADFVGKYKVSYSDLNYTIPSTTSATLPTLSMRMEVMLTYTEEEKEDESLRPTAEEMLAFEAAIERLEPAIRDHLQQVVDSMSLQEIQKPVGKSRIKSEMRSYINDRLEGIDFEDKVREQVSKRRVTSDEDVKITQFILSR